MTKSENPLLDTWETPFGAPPFDRIEAEHFEPAFADAMAAHNAEIEAITSSAEKPSFANTIEALERSGRALRRVSSTFYNLSAAHTSDELQAIERAMAPKMAAHYGAIGRNADLFARIDALVADGDGTALTPEQARVLERTHSGFVRSGARLDGDGRKRMEEIDQRLAELGTRFSQNVLADEKAYELVLQAPDDLAGLPQFLKDAAAAAARERGHADGSFVITLSRSLIEPFLQFSERRDLRETAFKAWISRGENGGDTDNREIANETIALRTEKARLLGFDSFAAYKLDDEMAKTPAAVDDLLTEVWRRGRMRAEAEAEKLSARAASEGANIVIAPWDWRHYAEKVRKAEHDIDEAEVKPYFQLESMIEAAFDTAGRLFGLRFEERGDVPTYHPDVRVFDVTDGNGAHVAVFVGDYFARPSKRSGAWMSLFRGQHKLDGGERPIVVNVMNFAKGAPGEATLLTADDARTLFHEFGHGLHGMLSDVTYPSVSCTNVVRDFVELPSQLYEHWLLEPEVLGRHARHYKTGEPIPRELLEKLKAAETFDQGFATVEYTASALVDLRLHMSQGSDTADVMQVESEILDEIGMPDAITMRHRSPHFAHIFSGGGYAAGYYSYLWSEVMDADAFNAFKEAGDVFDAETAGRLRDAIYSAGGRQDPAEAYIAFRGRKPTTDSLFAKRGLDAS